MDKLTCCLNNETKTSQLWVFLSQQFAKMMHVKNMYFLQLLSTFMTYVFEYDYSKWRQMRRNKLSNMDFKWMIYKFTPTVPDI